MNNTKPIPAGRPRLASLSLLITLWSAGIIAVAMGGYAVWQYYAYPGTTFKELMMHHLWHVLILGAVIQFSLWICFRQLLFKPLNSIYLHLYDLGTGSLSTLNLNTSVEEVQTIVDGINLMTWRLDQWMDVDALREMQGHVEEIKILAGKSNTDPQVGDALMSEACTLEQTIQTIISERDIANQTFSSEHRQPVSHGAV